MRQVNYNNPRKNKWRSIIWKQLAKEATKNKPAFDCKILYLAGEKSLDVKLARKYGFDPNKMIAVEMDSAVADSLRADQRFVVEGRLSEVVYNWDRCDIDIIIADYCSQWCNEQWMLLQGLLNKHFQNCWIVINCMAGRETGDVNLVTQLRRFDIGDEKFEELFKRNHVQYFILEHLNATLRDFEDSGFLEKGNASTLFKIAMKKILPVERYVGKKAPFDSVIFYNSLGCLLNYLGSLSLGIDMPSYNEYKKISKQKIYHELDLVTKP